MKKFLAILVSLLLVLSFTLLVGCKKKEEAPAPAATTEQAPAAEMSPAPAAEQTPAAEMSPAEKAAPEKAPEKKKTGGY